jgi:endonuclease III
MTSSNRAAKYEALYKSLKKHFKPTPDAPDRTVLEHLLYACCLEDARYDQADEAFAKLQQTYFDWNEVRVTTIAELGEALTSLPFASQAGARIKQCLQALFESRYQYDVDDLKKANLGKAIAELEAWKGITPYIVSYVSQHALGGHSIPISNLILDALVQCEAITPQEAEKGTVPGLERAIPKNKGSEFASLLHQFAVELHLHPKSGAAPLVLKDLGVTYKVKPKLSETKPSAGGKAAATPAATRSSTPAPGKTVPQTQAEISATPAKKGDAKKDSKEAGKAPQKGDATKSAAKSPASKKMTPPATSSKDTGSKKDSGSKALSPKEEKKHGGSEGDKAKANPTPAKGKPESKPAPQKGAAGKKTSGNSTIASSITKKKPK